MDQAFALSVTTTAIFSDGLGERRRVSDPAGKDAFDVWYVDDELAAVPSFESALRARVTELADFRHPCFSPARRVDRLNNGTQLAVTSDASVGIRLSELLQGAEQRHMPFDIQTALWVTRQLVSAVAALHEQYDQIAHGALAPERLVITPRGRLVVLDHVAGSALEQLRFSHQRYWKDLRVALPRSAGLPRFDHRVDVTQIGVVALSLMLGRLLKEYEYPARLNELVGSVLAISTKGDLEPLSPALRTWLSRALQLDLRTAFASVDEAGDELERVLASDGLVTTELASLEGFLGRYHDRATATAPPVVPSAPRTESAAEPIAVVSRVLRPVPRAEAPRPAAPRAEVPRQAAPRPPSPSSVEVPLSNLTSAPRLEAPRANVPRVEVPRTDVPRADVPPANATSGTPRLAPTPLPAPQTDVDARTISAAAGSLSAGLVGVAAVAIVLIAATAGGVLAARRYVFAGGAGAAGAGTGTLTVNSNPVGAQVVVDGELRGVTPTTLTLPSGSHKLELRGAGEPRTLAVAVSAGAQISQYIELSKSNATTGRLQVRTDPAGAQVTVDSVSRGASPVTVADLDPGQHEVVVAGDTGSVIQAVTVEAGMTSSLVVPLGVPNGASLSGWISVTSAADVQLFEKGRLLGSSQSDRIMVAAGSHQIDLVNEALGYRATRTVQVTPGKVAQVALKLPMGSMAVNAIPWAEVWIDGEKAGDTPIGNLQATIGTHEIVFRNPDLGEVRQAVTVTMAAPARLSVDMRKK